MGTLGFERKAVRMDISSWGLGWATWSGLNYWGL